MTEIDLLEWSKQSLDYWLSLARLHDTHGLPTDLIYIVCESESALPRVIQNGELRAVTSAEFETGIRDCVRLLQVGGVESLGENSMHLRGQ